VGYGLQYIEKADEGEAVSGIRSRQALGADIAPNPLERKRSNKSVPGPELKEDNKQPGVIFSAKSEEVVEKKGKTEVSGSVGVDIALTWRREGKYGE